MCLSPPNPTRCSYRGQALWFHARFSRDSYDSISFRGKYVEPSALPVPMVENGDFVGTLPRKSLRVSSKAGQAAAPPVPEKADKEGFPQQIHKLVTAMTASIPAIISFSDDGEKIQVREDHPDLGDVLEENFGNPRVGFFSQNLLAYGWSRDSDPKYVHWAQLACSLLTFQPCAAPPNLSVSLANQITHVVLQPPPLSP